MKTITLLAVVFMLCTGCATNVQEADGPDTSVKCCDENGNPNFGSRSGSK